MVGEQARDRADAVRENDFITGLELCDTPRRRGMYRVTILVHRHFEIDVQAASADEAGQQVKHDLESVYPEASLIDVTDVELVG